MSIIVFLTLSVLCLYCDAKQFSRCDLVWELRRQGFEESKLRDWVCLVESQSERYTNRIGTLYADGSKDYGLFQINDRYWCEDGYAGKECHITCAELLYDDITVAANCAKIIYKRHGFNAWVGWKNKCQSGLPDIRIC